MKRFQITEYCHELILKNAPGFSVCIDATTGNGSDTEFLSRQAGAEGKVYGFDIQKTALDHTRERLERSGCPKNTELILDSHDKIEEYVRGEADVIVFNFGYLPGGDHGLSTKPATSIPAIEAGLRILKKGGLMSLCIYSGRDSGHEEKTAILSFLKILDPKKFLVITHEYFNRPNDPPLPVSVIKL